MPFAMNIEAKMSSSLTNSAPNAYMTAVVAVQSRARRSQYDMQARPPNVQSVLARKWFAAVFVSAGPISSRPVMMRENASRRIDAKAMPLTTRCERWHFVMAIRSHSTAKIASATSMTPSEKTPSSL